MPIHLSTLNRRQFLVALGAGVVSCSVPAFGKESVEEDLVYILNDTHVGEKHPPDSPVPSNLRQVVEELIDRRQKPACVLINGDLALRDGQPGDYRHFEKLIRPLQKAGLDLHLTLGNHDHRDVFYDVLKDERPGEPVVKSRHVAVVQTKKANFFLLDSLIKTMVTQGEVGKEQLRWLTNSLDRFDSKPAVIVAHHNPRLGGDPLHFPGGLIDSQPLWDTLAKRPHVKAYVHGHVHHRSFAEHENIHIVNTPATSYVANPKESTTGWTTLRLTDEKMTVTTFTNAADHPWNGKAEVLQWKR